MDQPTPTPARRRTRAQEPPEIPGSPAAAETAATTPQPSLLERLERCAAECEQVERVLGGRGLPELETIIKLHRLLILRLSLEAEAAPEMFKLIESLMKPVMDWARLEEKRKDRELAEQKHRDELEAEKTARSAEGAAAATETLQPRTLEQIEQELSLL